MRIFGGYSWICQRRTTAKTSAKDVANDQERKSGARRRLDIVVV